MGTLALGFSVLVFSQGATAKNPGKPSAEGSESCGISSGTLKLTPQSGSPGTMGVALTAVYPPNPCAGTAHLSGGGSVTISGLALKGQGTATASPTGDICDLGTITVTLSWKSGPKVAPTMLSYQGGTWSPPGPPNLPASGGSLMSDTGSFSGGAATFSPKSVWPPNPCAGTKPITVHITGGTLAIGPPSAT